MSIGTQQIYGNSYRSDIQNGTDAKNTVFHKERQCYAQDDATNIFDVAKRDLGKEVKVLVFDSIELENNYHGLSVLGMLDANSKDGDKTFSRKLDYAFADKTVMSRQGLVDIVAQDTEIDAVNLSIGSMVSFDEIKEITGIDLKTTKVSKEDLRDAIMNSTSKNEQLGRYKLNIEFLEEIEKMGVDVYTAAGNDGSEQINMFGIANGVTVVGAIDKNNMVAKENSSLDYIDILTNENATTITSTKDQSKRNTLVIENNAQKNGLYDATLAAHIDDESYMHIENNNGVESKNILLATQDRKIPSGKPKNGFEQASLTGSSFATPTALMYDLQKRDASEKEIKSAPVQQQNTTALKDEPQTTAPTTVAAKKSNVETTQNKSEAKEPNIFKRFMNFVIGLFN